MGLKIRRNVNPQHRPQEVGQESLIKTTRTKNPNKTPFWTGMLIGGITMVVVVLLGVTGYNRMISNCSAPSSQYTEVQGLVVTDLAGNQKYIGGGYYTDGTGVGTNSLAVTFSVCGSSDKRLKSVKDFMAYIDGKPVIFPKAVVGDVNNLSSSPLALEP